MTSRKEYPRFFLQLHLCKTLFQIFIIILITPAVILGMVYTGSMYNMEKYGPPVATKTPKLSTEEIIDRTENALKAVYGSEYRAEFDRERMIYRVGTWSEGINDEFVAEIEELQAYDQWKTVTDGLIDVTSDIQHYFTDYGQPDVVVVMSLLNPENPDIAYATAAQGVIGYDVVNGIDLLNQNGA